MSRVSIVPVNSKVQLRRFMRLPLRLQAADGSYVPPLERDQLAALTPGSNPYFEHAEARFFLAVRDGRDVGRISAQVDWLVSDERAGHFGFIAAEDDPEVFAALFGAAEAWLRERGRTRVQGPFSLSMTEQCGLLIRGFNTPPMIGMPHDPPYAGHRVEEQGYAKARDAIACLYDTHRELPAAARRRVDRPHTILRVRQFDMLNYESEFESVFGMFDDACSGNWGFVPGTPAQTRHVARTLKPLIDPALTAIVELRGKLVGAGIIVLNRNEIIRDFRGSLFPFQYIKLRWRTWRNPRSGRASLLGIRRDRRSGLLGGIAPWLIIDSLRRGALARGMRDVELSWILEDNMPMRKIVEALGSDPYKSFRIYQKILA